MEGRRTEHSRPPKQQKLQHVRAEGSTFTAGNAASAVPAKRRRRAKLVADRPVAWDVLESLYESGCYTLAASGLLAFVLYVVVIQLTHRGDIVDSHPAIAEVRAMGPLEAIRPVLSREEQLAIRDERMHAFTTFEVGERHVRVGFLPQHAVKDGHERLPELFYNGLFFGLSAENPHRVEAGSDHGYMENEAARDDLAAALRDLPHVPDQVYNRHTVSTVWAESGVAAFYDLRNLDRSYGTLRGAQRRKTIEHWIDLLRSDILKVARAHRQMTIYIWSPHYWGVGEEDDIHLHANVVQHVVPTRTGLPHLRTTSVVWLDKFLAPNEEIDRSDARSGIEADSLIKSDFKGA